MKFSKAFPKGDSVVRTHKPVKLVSFVSTLSLSLVITCCIVGLLFFQLTWSIDRTYHAIWEKAYDALGIPSESISIPRVQGDIFILFGGTNTFLIWWWGAPLVALVASVFLLWIPGRHAVLDSVKPVQRVLCHPIPFGRINKAVEGWCGGVTIGEALVLLIWTGDNANQLQRIYRARAENFATVSDTTGESIASLRMETVALAFGVMCFHNFGWIFFPISRNSPLFDVMGLSFERRIKYHRWLSFLAIFVMVAHGLLYWLYWLIHEEWIEQALEMGELGVSNLAGGIAMVFGIVIAISSLEWFRRKYFEIFYRTHIVGFLGFILFSNMHVNYYIYMCAGLLMYVVDVVLRTSQVSLPVSVESSQLNSDGTITTVKMKAPKDMKTNGVPIVWVHSDNLSVCQWHAVTPILGADGTLTFYFKSFGRWSQGMASLTKAGQLTSLRMEGPHDMCSAGFFQEMLQHKTLVFCAGGVAITPVLSMLQVLKDGLASFEESEALEVMPEIKLFWVVRSSVELEVGSRSLVTLERKYPDKVQIEIYVTGSKGENLPQYEPKKPLRLPVAIRKLFTRSASRTMVRTHYGRLHLALLYIVAYGAGYAGLILGNSWRLERLRATAEPPLTYWKSAIIKFTVTMLMSLGWVALMVIPFQFTAMFWEKRKEADVYKPLDSSDKNEEKANDMAYTQELIDRGHPGRPDFPSLLQAIPNKKEVSVLAAGPEVMVSLVKEASTAQGFGSFAEGSFFF